MDNGISVAELFAGVGGFRLGLEGWKGTSALSGYKKRKRSPYQVVWSNQWEPKGAKQTASDMYAKRFGDKGHTNADIASIAVADIPDHDLLVGGFPCQDYSIARPVAKSKGLAGEKGMLWWQIHRILKGKIRAGVPVKYILLENVDRLLKSPSKAPGADFATILASLGKLGYAVEWRVVNAADYGFPQKRKRVFIVGFYKSTSLYGKLHVAEHREWLLRNGLFGTAFPVLQDNSLLPTIMLKEGITTVFRNSGVMIRGKVATVQVRAVPVTVEATLGSILQAPAEVPKRFRIAPEKVAQWRQVKAPGCILRISKGTQTPYYYTRWEMPFPDSPDKPSRTIITSEGESTVYRTTHVIAAGRGKFRRLTPVELERLNMFPDDFTAGLSDRKRGFLMGNALVVGVVERIGNVLANRISETIRFELTIKRNRKRHFGPDKNKSSHGLDI